MGLTINLFKLAVVALCLAIAACEGGSSADSQLSSAGNASVAAVIKSAATAASPNGTTIPSATQIVDSGGNRWTVSGYVVYENGSLAGHTDNVTLLLYENGNIYQQNSAGAWFVWNGSTWLAGSDPGWSSPAGTTLPGATQIIDSGGHRWTLSGGVVLESGVFAGQTGNVTLLLYENGRIYQQNSSGAWYVWNGSTWVASSDPGWSSPAGTAIPTATQIVDSGGNRWTVSGYVVYKNGALAAHTDNVTLLLYEKGNIYQQNSAGAWFVWNGSAWLASSDPGWSSPAGTTLPGATQIIDSGGHRWTLSGGVVRVSGVLAGQTGNATLLLYENGKIYQQNSSGAWFVWNGSTWLASSDPGWSSPAGTNLPAATQIIDSSGNRWTLSGDVVYENAALAGYTNDVTLLLYENGRIYQQNSSGAWYVWNGSTWVASKDPGWSSPAGTSIPTTTQIIDSGGNRWTVSGYVVYKNGALAAHTDNVTLLLYEKGNIYQQNSAGAWFVWNGSAWLASSDPGWSSPAGTTLPGATQIIDSGGHRWTLSGGVVRVSGVLAGQTANATLLLYENGRIYEQDASGDWYFWCVNTWLGTNDPREGGVALGIGGTPLTSDIAGLAYRFLPTITNPGAGTLRFSITNKPAWASFSTLTGELTGTPNITQVGKYSDIVVGISTENESASHAAFSITVGTGSATLSWTAPTENTNGTPLNDLAGYTIYYGTSASELTQTVEVADPSTTTYVVGNLTAGTYYFAVTSYTTKGVQSAKSAVESANIM